MIRAETRAAIAQRMRAKVEPLGAVLYQWPDDYTPAPDRVVILAVDLPGDIDIPTFEGGPKRASERFRFEVYIESSAAHRDKQAAEALCCDLCWAAMYALLEDPALGGLSKPAPPVGTWRLKTAVPHQPGAVEILELPDGAFASTSFIVQCEATIYP